MKPAGTLLLLLSCLLVFGCTQASRDKRDTRNLANRASEMSAALTSAGIPFSEHINAWLAGEKTDIPALKAALGSIAPLPEKYRAEFEKMPYPENQYAVTAYRTSFLNYLEGQQELAASLKGIVEKVSLKNPGDEPLRKEVSEEFRVMAEAQQKTLTDIKLKAERLTSYLLE